MIKTTSMCNLIAKIVVKIERLKSAGFTPKTIIISEKHAGIIIAAQTRTSFAACNPSKILGLPVIIKGKNNEIEIGV
jgi:hypothetical protein